MFLRLLYHLVSLLVLREGLWFPLIVETSLDLFVASVQSSLQVSSNLVERAAQTFSSSVQETRICKGCS